MCNNLERDSRPRICEAMEVNHFLLELVQMSSQVTDIPKLGISVAVNILWLFEVCSWPYISAFTISTVEVKTKDKRSNREF